MTRPGTAYKAYIGTVVAFGAAAVAYSLYRVVQDSVSYQWLILAYLTVLTGAFTVRIPRVNSKFSVSDTFIFINTILFGAAAGVLTGALDGLVGSIRSMTASKRKQTIPFNTAVLGLSVFLAGEVFFRMLGRGPLAEGGEPLRFAQLVLPLLFAAFAYYLCNSMFVAAMLSLDGGGNAVRIWRQGLVTTLAITLAGVAAGAILAFSVRSITPLTLLVVVPVLVVAYFINEIYLGPGTGAGEAAGASALSVVRRPAYRRFHYFMVALGLGFVILLLQNVLSRKLEYVCLIIAGLAVLAGFVTVKIPGIKIKFSLADTFVFANTILFGPVVGGITAALDGLAGSMRCKSRNRRWEFTMFNIAGMALSGYLAGELFFLVLGQGPAYGGRAIRFEETFLPAVVLAISYYLLNTLGVAVIVALQAKEKVVRVWRDNLMWGLTVDVACALGAMFTAAGIVALSPPTSIAVLLTLAIIYVGLRFTAERMPRKIIPPA